MAGKRPRKRASNEAFFVDVFATNTTLGWKVIRRVRVEFALEQLALKKWREVWLDSGDLAGVQPLRPDPAQQQSAPELLVALTITLQELMRNAGLCGGSRKPGDAVDRAKVKVRLWPHPASVKRDARGDAVRDGNGNLVFADKAVRVYPKAQ